MMLLWHPGLETKWYCHIFIKSPTATHLSNWYVSSFRGVGAGYFLSLITVD